MTDLSKELGEIKRRQRTDLREIAGDFATWECQMVADKERLLHIIEVEIPKFIRDYPASIHGALAITPAEIAGQVANEIASAIESLTKSPTPSEPENAKAI